MDLFSFSLYKTFHFEGKLDWESAMKLAQLPSFPSMSCFKLTHENYSFLKFTFVTDNTHIYF